MRSLLVVVLLAAMTISGCSDDDDPAGPSPPSGACCLTAGTCVVTTQANCPGTWTEGGACTPNPCSQPTGACCAAMGTCAVTTEDACASPNVWHGNWPSCELNPCPQPTGACCVGTTCIVATQAACTGTWMGANAPCVPNPCPQPTTGACCVGTTCMVTTQAACTGTWHGDNSPCTSTLCGGVAVGTITGTAGLAAGVPGDLGNTIVSVYTSLEDWNNYRPLTSVAGTSVGPSQITFTFTNAPPGTYYLDCWKDNDLSGSWSGGDFIGVFGTSVWPGMTPAPFSVAAGLTTSIAVTIIGIPG